MPKNNHGRVRELHPEFFTDEKLMQVSLEANRLFLGLITLCDREGCLEEPHPLNLKAKFFAAWNVDCAPMLAELDKVGLIVRYRGVDLSAPERGTLQLLWLPGFRHRSKRLMHPREVNSCLQPCPSDTTPFSNWVERKDKTGKVLNPAPEVEPRQVLGGAWVVLRYCQGARYLSGPFGISRDLSKISPLPPSHAKGVQKKKPRGSRRDPNDGIVTHPPVEPTWSNDSPEGKAFRERLDAVADSGATYAADQLQRLTPRLADGVLVLEAADPYFEDFVREHYIEHLNATGPPVVLRSIQPPPL